MDWPNIIIPTSPITIIPQSINGVLGGQYGGAVFSWASWPTANKAILWPFRLTRPFLAAIMFVYNGTTNGNFDIGIYDAAGTRIVSSGSTAQSGANDVQTVNITDTWIGPGLFYVALAFNGTTAQVAYRPASSIICRIFGMVCMADAFPLPATINFTSLNVDFLPMCGISSRSTL